MLFRRVRNGMKAEKGTNIEHIAKPQGALFSNFHPSVARPFSSIHQNFESHYIHTDAQPEQTFLSRRCIIIMKKKINIYRVFFLRSPNAEDRWSELRFCSFEREFLFPFLSLFFPSLWPIFPSVTIVRHPRPRSQRAARPQR